MVKHIGFIVILAMICGCDVAPFESEKSDRGETIIVNKWTGNVYKLIGDKLVELDKISIKNRKGDASPKKFNAKPIEKHKINVSLGTIYRNEILYYKITISPINSLKEAREVKDKKEVESWNKTIEENRVSFHNISIKFTDFYGFNIKEVDVPLNKFLRVIDSDGNVSEYEAQGKIELEYSDYMLIASWRIGWNF